LFQCIDEPQTTTLPSVVILGPYFIRINESKDATYSVLENTLLSLFLRVNYVKSFKAHKLHSSQTFRQTLTKHLAKAAMPYSLGATTDMSRRAVWYEYSKEHGVTHQKCPHFLFKMLCTLELRHCGG